MFMGFQKMWTAIIMPAVSTAITAALSGIGVTPNMTVGTVITMVLTGFMVWLIPNTK